MTLEQQVILCRQAEKETQGSVTHVTITNLVCNRAHECRRRGICTLSDLAHQNVQGHEGHPDELAMGERNLYILQYRNSLGYYWQRVATLEEGRGIYEDPNRAFEVPRVLRTEIIESI